MCYWILNQNGKVVSRSTVQPIPALELSLPTTKETLRIFDCAIEHHLKCGKREYDGDKPNPEDWSDMFEEDEDFREEFERVYNDDSIKEDDANHGEAEFIKLEDTLETRLDVGSLIGDECKQDEGR